MTQTLDHQVEAQAEAATALPADEVFDLADAIEDAMTAKPGRDWTPSELGRATRQPTAHVRQVLGWMLEQRYIAASGNGAWTRYSERRA